MPVKLLVLGPLEVHGPDGAVRVRRGRPRRLLLALVLRLGGAVPPDTLIDDLWGDEAPVNADNALQILVSYLRKALAPTGIEIERAPTGYRLQVSPDDVDMTRFEQLVRAATAPGEAAEAQLDASTGALALWRGTPLAEATDDEFARGALVRLEELRLAAVETRAQALLVLGRHADALPELSEVVREHPFRERFHGQLALALYRAGRQAEALQALERARAALVDELGLDPSGELQELERAILRQDPSLDAAVAPAPPPSRALPPEARSAPGREVAGPPAPLTRLVGRESELASLRQLVAGHRLLTLTGPGGVGKTRMAAELARDGGSLVVWCDLSGVDASSQVSAAVAAASAIPLGSGDDPLDVVRLALSTEPALLVLDTCEHVLDGARAVVDGLLASCPQLTVLATSRRPLGVAGELAWPVPPLTLPDPHEQAPEPAAASAAVRLFVERAAAARPGFAMTPENTGSVARICLLLDGLPLAIELAAAHVAALSPAKVVELLDDRLRLLGKAAERTGRHAGLRAVMDWSYELLDPEERLFLDRLSVFTGSFPVEAAVEVAGADVAADGLQLLLGLVRQSLVAPADLEDRFRLLDTVRAYAAERYLDRSEEERLATQDRHARWWADFAADADRGIRGPDQQGWLAEVRAAAPDLRSALRHALEARPAALGARLALALSWYWSFDGRFREARGWLRTALGVPGIDDATAGRLLVADAMHAASLGELQHSAASCRQALALLLAAGDEAGRAEGLLHLGIALWANGESSAAASAQDDAVNAFLTLDDDWGRGLALVVRARTALDLEGASAARELLVDALHLLRRTGDQHLVGLCLEQLSRAALVEGDVRRADELAAEALGLHERVGYAEGVVACLHTLALVRLERGDPEGARGLLLRSAEQAVALSHAAAVAETVELLAEAWASRGDPARAAQLLAHADALRGRLRIPRPAHRRDRVERWAASLPDALGAELDRRRRLGEETSTEDLLAEVG